MIDTETQSEEQRLRNNERIKQDLLAFRETFTTPAGERVLAYLKNYTGYGFPSYQLGSENTLDSVFCDGKKDVHALIMHQMNAPFPDDSELQITAEDE